MNPGVSPDDTSSAGALAQMVSDRQRGTLTSMYAH